MNGDPTRQGAADLSCLDFTAAFEALTGHAPLSWQRKWYEDAAAVP